MKFSDIDLSEMPESMTFAKFVDQRFYLWENYTPTTIEADIPFEQDWWKYLYWMPKIKKEFYLMAISSLRFREGLIRLTEKYGMDYCFFLAHYNTFVKRLEWMRKSGSNHIGEITK